MDQKQTSETTGPLTPTAIDVASLPITQEMSAQWVDTMEVAIRSDAPICMLRGFYFMEDRRVEVCRLQITVAHLKRMGQIFGQLAEQVELAVQQQAATESETPKTD